MKVNCSVACDGNITSFGLETHWHKTEVDHRDKWKIFELSNVENDGTLLCHAVCQGNQTQVQGNLTVYWFPEYVKLANLSWQREGQHFNLSCQVSGGAPRTNLSAVLFRGRRSCSGSQWGWRSLPMSRSGCWPAERTTVPISLVALS